MFSMGEGDPGRKWTQTDSFQNSNKNTVIWRLYKNAVFWPDMKFFFCWLNIVTTIISMMISMTNNIFSIFVNCILFVRTKNKEIYEMITLENFRQNCKKG